MLLPLAVEASPAAASLPFFSSSSYFAQKPFISLVAVNSRLRIDSTAPFKDHVLFSRHAHLRLLPPFAGSGAGAFPGNMASPEPTEPTRTTTPKIDRTGRFCSPRAARELALLVSYAACLEGTDPVRLFDKRVNAKREPGFVFDKTVLLKYDHMSFGGAPVEVGTEEEAEELMLRNETDSVNEANVLSAPPRLVYNRFVLRFARDLLEAIVNRWNQHVVFIDKIIPRNWKDEPTARILELCILHLAMSEMTAKGTRHQIVINEAVDLAKRFCDGGAPRIINGCLRTFIKDFHSVEATQLIESTV